MSSDQQLGLVEAVHLEIEGLDEPVEVTGLVAQERLFELGECRVTGLTELAPDGGRLLGATASVRVEATSGERYWHGIVASISVSPRALYDFTLTVTIVPALFQLTLGQDARIQRRRTVQQIVDDTVERAGLADADIRWSLTENLPVHDNVHQYNESDYCFFRRLLAEEGLCFCVENSLSESCVHVFDSPSALPLVEHIDALAPSAGPGAAFFGLHAINEQHCARSGSVSMRDFDVERPRDRARASASASGGSGPQVYLHPAGFETDHPPRIRARRAKRAVEALVRDARVIDGTSSAVHLEAGRRVLVQGHGRVDLNEELILSEVIHRFERAEGTAGAYAYHNEFRALPADVMPRPDLSIARPRAQGLQPAIVTAPGGLEHHSDSLGRVRVRFRWDRSDTDDSHSSTWCRVAHPQLPSSQVIPRAGFEVDVDHEQGDWDRPTVIGHRYNDERLVPYPLPAGGALSAWQSATLTEGPLVNELRFDDTRGAEELYWHASMNLRREVEHDSVRRITREEVVSVGVRRALTVTRSLTRVVGNNRDESVGRDVAVRVGRNHTEAVGENETLTCNRRRLQNGGDLVEQVRGSLTRTVGPIQVVGGVASLLHRTIGSSTASIGTALVETVAGDRMLNVRGDLTLSTTALYLVETGTFRVNVDGNYDNTFSALTLDVGTDQTDHAESAARITASGDLTLVAEHVSVTATDQLSISAGSCEIVLSSSGEITLRAPRVNLRNADAIGATVEVN